MKFEFIVETAHGSIQGAAAITAGDVRGQNVPPASRNVYRRTGAGTHTVVFAVR